MCVCVCVCVCVRLCVCVSARAFDYIDEATAKYCSHSTSSTNRYISRFGNRSLHRSEWYPSDSSQYRVLSPYPEPLVTEAVIDHSV